MLKVYVSSTFADLVSYRDAARRTIERFGHHAVAMESYVAADERPLPLCLNDVSSCDVYVCIVGWRYGFIPVDENPDRKSITELEYLEAGRANRPRLIFLSREDVPWPLTHSDSHTGKGDSGALVRAFRELLARDHVVSFFESPDDLAAKLGAAIHRIQHGLSPGVRPDAMLLKRLAHSIPLASRLAAHLNLARDAYQAQDTRFVSGSLLLALLRSPERFTFERFDETRPGLAREIAEILANYVADVLPDAARGFQPFDWVERADVQRAQFHALAEESPVVQEKHLLLGLLEEPTAQAIADLRSHIGPTTFEELLRNVRRAKATRTVLASPRWPRPRRSDPANEAHDD